MTNAAVGCAVGLAVLLTGQSSELKMPIAISIAVLVSSYFVRIPTMWRQAPITAAFVISASLTHHSRVNALQAGAKRMAEVLYGCVVGLVIAWIVSRVWPEAPKEATPPKVAEAAVTPPGNSPRSS